MQMGNRRVLIVACVIVGLPGAALAQILRSVEIAPFYGYRFGGSLTDDETGEKFRFDDSASWGGTVAFRVGETKQVEFYYSRQDTRLRSDTGLFGGEALFDLNIDYYHIGGTYILNDGPWQPFVVGTIGATHLDPRDPDASSLTRLSLGLGGGVRFFVTENLGLYAAGRGLFTSIGSQVLFRSEAGQAIIKVDGSGLGQAELQVGLIFAF